MTSTTTKQLIHGVSVITTEVTTAAGVVRTYEGLVEAMEQPYRNLTTQETLRRISEKNRKILRDNRELVEQFVT